MRIVFAALVLVVLTGLPSAGGRTNGPSDLEQVDVFVAGDGGYHTYRIPSVIATPGGALLAFAEGRRANSSDTGDIDLVMRRSDDGGRAWSPLVVVGDNGPHTFGNPCPVVDRRTGTIWLLTTHNRGEDREQAIIDGSSSGTRTVWVMHSTDDGRSWSEPRDITQSVKRSDWTWYATGPGMAIQTRTGRLVVPANHAVAGSQIHRSHLIYSDDGGASWTIGGVSVDGTNESQVVELADGRLMLNMRNHPRKEHNVRVVAESVDGGETLGAPRYDSTLVEPPAQASLIRVGSDAPDDRGRLLFGNPSGPGRARMTVRVSEDVGASWPVKRVVHAGPAAYSCLVALQDGRVGLLYERGDRSPYERITFATFSLDWLSAGDDASSPR
jgi:sialidase-1